MITRRRIVTVAAVAAALIGVSVPAWAYFTATASSNITASAKTLAAVTGPTATTVNSTDATVSWTDTTNPSGTTYTGTATMVQSPHTVVTCVVTGMTCKASALTASTQYTFSVTPALGASWTGPAATVQVTTQAAATASKLVFTSAAVSGPASSSANLGAITVQEQSASGAPVAAASDVTVNLSSDSPGTATFAANSGGPSVISIKIPAGSSSVSLYYGDTKAGSPTITASATGLSSATQTENVNGGAYAALQFVNCTKRGIPTACTSLTSVGNGGTVMGSVEALDGFGNVTAPAGTITVNLSSTNSQWPISPAFVTITSSVNPSGQWQVTYNSTGTSNTTIKAVDSSNSSIATSITAVK